MKEYREKLKLQNFILLTCSLTLLFFALLSIGTELGWFQTLRPATGDSQWHSTWYGFICGVSCGLLALMLTCFIRNRRALKDEARLKKLYVKTHDERTTHIQTLARNTSMQLLLYIGLVSTVIAGYFNMTVSLTILACTFVCSLTTLVLTGYYNKKL